MLEESLGSVQSTLSHRVMSDRPSVAVRNYKLRGRCKTFDATGHCRFGDLCRYRHRQEESLSSGPEINSEEKGNIQSHDSRQSKKNEGPVRKPKTPAAAVPKTCRSFSQTGACRYGDNCRYYHERPSQRRTEDYYFEDDLISNPNYDHDSPLLCKVFTRTGYCRYENSCRFAHVQPETLELRAAVLDAKFFRGDTSSDVDPGQKKARKPKPQDVKRSVAGRAKCRFFMAGYCKLADRCKFVHPENGPAQKTTEADVPGSESDGKAKAKHTEVKVKPGVKPVVARKMVHNIADLASEDFLKLRETEIQQLKKRYPKREEESQGDDIKYKITFVPTDPEWVYDVKSIDLSVSFPATYPTDRMTVSLCDNEALPDSVQKFLSGSISDWIYARYQKLVKEEKVELMFRPFLKWLDKAIEDLFTDALQQYKRQILAQQAGLVFVPAAELKEKYAKMQSESEEEKSDSEAGDDKDGKDAEDPENDEEEDAEEVKENKQAEVIDPARKGTEVKLANLQLKENAATLQPVNVMMNVQCNRCRNRTEFKTPVGQTSSIECHKCNQAQIITFRGAVAHEFSSIIGYVDLDGCVAFDMILPETTFTAGCLNCNKVMKMEGLIPGQIKDTWCHYCHGKMRIGSDNVRFLVLQPSEHVTGHIVALENKKIRKVPKDPAIKEGFPLPNNGTCKHYKKSFRWLRFPCCGKTYPCDVCHDENEDHEMKYANRMICGYCCKEQTYSVEKPCIACSSAMTKKTGTHWEGGKGCRDKIKMSRNDEKKYANTNKTLSRKSQKAPSTGQKTTKLRHS